MSWLGHGLAPVQDLPLPTWLFYYGGAFVLVASFVALGVLWKRPRFEGRELGRPLPPGLQRILLSPVLRVVLGALSVGVLCVVVAAALFGTDSAGRNIAPTFVYVVFWLGFVPVSVLIGHVWSVLSPWRAVADFVAWLSSRRGDADPPFTYPERLGRLPAVVGLFAFATLELVYTERSDPRAVGIAILVYSWMTWLGMAAFGRRTWLENGEAFNVYFGLLSRIAPFALRERDGRRELVARPPLSGLAEREDRRGTVLFVAVMLGSVAFDGFSRSGVWDGVRSDVLGSKANELTGAANLARQALDLVGLALTVGVVALAFLVCVEAARRTGRAREGLAYAFIASLVPIALAYAVAHYFTLFVVGGQLAIPLLSDPFGWGWDLFGTNDFQANVVPFAPRTVWYIQSAALVAGHVAGLVLAHDRAVAIFRSAGSALRTQYAMLVLMVFYTVGGLWLLANG